MGSGMTVDYDDEYNWGLEVIGNETDQQLADRLEAMSKFGETPGRASTLREAARRLRPDHIPKVEIGQSGEEECSMATVHHCSVCGARATIMMHRITEEKRFPVVWYCEKHSNCGDAFEERSI